jgi:hypothetical protein
MVHIEKTKGSLKESLMAVNSLGLIGIRELKAAELFDKVLQLCIETNEVTSLSIGRIYGSLVCKPVFKDDLFDKQLHEYLFVEPTIQDYFSDFKQSEIIQFPSRKHWEVQDYDDLKEIALLDNIETMMMRSFLVAKRILARFEHEVGVVCGPISSGLKSIPENFRTFNRTIFKLSQTMEVWSQMPFEAVFKNVHESLVAQQSPFLIEGSSSNFFIEKFYQPLFYLNKEWAPHFIFGYEHSRGAMEEKEIFALLKKKMVFLPEGYEMNLF